MTPLVSPQEEGGRKSAPGPTGNCQPRPSTRPQRPPTFLLLLLLLRPLLLPHALAHLLPKFPTDFRPPASLSLSLLEKSQALRFMDWLLFLRVHFVLSFLLLLASLGLLAGKTQRKCQKGFSVDSLHTLETAEEEEEAWDKRSCREREREKFCPGFLPLHRVLVDQTSASLCFFLQTVSMLFFSSFLRGTMLGPSASLGQRVHIHVYVRSRRCLAA